MEPWVRAVRSGVRGRDGGGAGSGVGRRSGVDRSHRDPTGEGGPGEGDGDVEVGTLQYRPCSARRGEDAAQDRAPRLGIAEAGRRRGGQAWSSERSTYGMIPPLR